MKICFNGCSFTVGRGFSEHDRDTYVYDRLVCNNLKLERTNIARSGSSNYLIFMRSVDAIMSNEYDILVTQWSGLNRIWLFPGPDAEIYVNGEPRDFEYRDIVFKKSEYKKLTDTLLMLNHDYQNIIDLIKYCKILESLAKTNNTKLIFINGLVPWTEDLFNYSGQNLATFLSQYSKDILDFNYRNDEEIVKFLDQLAEHHRTLNKDLWLNMFNSLKKMSVDDGPLSRHPGVKSNKIFAEELKSYILRNNMLGS